jgi:hypothetical protein
MGRTKESWEKQKANERWIREYGLNQAQKKSEWASRLRKVMKKFDSTRAELERLLAEVEGLPMSDAAGKTRKRKVQP